MMIVTQLAIHERYNIQVGIISPLQLLSSKNNDAGKFDLAFLGSITFFQSPVIEGHRGTPKSDGENNRNATATEREREGA